MDSKSAISFIVTLIVTSLLASCGKTEVIEVPFGVPNEYIVLEANDNRATITLSSPSPWKAESDAAWCKIFPTSGSATSSSGTSLTITVEHNDGFERSCHVTVTSQEGDKTVINLSQKISSEGVVLEKDIFRISGETTRLDIPFRCSGNIQAQSDAEWLRHVSIGDGNVLLEVEKHESLVNRSGLVRLSSSDGRHKDIRIVQGDGFDDPVLYEKLLESYDTDKDGILTKSDLSLLEEVTLNLTGTFETPVTDLSGFGCIPNLKVLQIIDYSYPFQAPLKLRLNDLKNLTLVDFGSDMGWDSGITDMEISGCPKLQKIDFPKGRRLENCRITNNQSLKYLRLINGIYSVDYTPIKHLVIEGCEGLESLTIGNATFQEEPTIGSMPNLRQIDIGTGTSVYGLRCLDLSESVVLEKVEAHSTDLEYILISHSLGTNVTINTSNKVTILYK